MFMFVDLTASLASVQDEFGAAHVGPLSDEKARRHCTRPPHPHAQLTTSPHPSTLTSPPHLTRQVDAGQLMQMLKQASHHTQPHYHLHSLSHAPTHPSIHTHTHTICCS